MIFKGEIKGGVVVFKAPPPLEDGTPVEVQPMAKALEPSPGTPEALMRLDARWVGPPDELDRLLAEVQQIRNAELLAAK